MNKPKRTQIDVGGIRDELERLAKQEKRSLAAMIRLLIEEALEARTRGKQIQSFELVDDSGNSTEISAVTKILTWDTEELAAKARISPERADLIQRGEKPTVDELIKLALLFHLKPAELKAQFEEKVPPNED